MALNDLDLEFEDEEVDKKSDAVSVDHDLEFGTDINISMSKAALEEKAAKPAPKPSIVAKGPAQESSAPKSHASNPAIINKATSNVRPLNTTSAMGSSALKVSPQIDHSTDQQLIDELHQRIEKVEFEAQVKVAVAEFKTDILSELLGDIKLLEHQIGGLLNRIYSKHPDLKQEALMIKKLLADFSQKKRK